MLDSLPPKWNLLLNSPTEVMGDEAEELEGDIRIFRPHLVTTGSLADMFRIFAEDDECPNTYNPQQETTPLDDVTVVYTDGSAIKCRTEDATAGASIFYGKDEPRNWSIQLPNEVGRTNQVSEIIGTKTVKRLCAQARNGTELKTLITPTPNTTHTNPQVHWGILMQ